ncbi:unnamed protein product, partial [Choristocarpus tenellus]
MFAGVDKHGGGVVGDIVQERATVITMGDSAETASAEETLVGKAILEDGTSKDVLMRSRVDPSSGGLCWLPVEDSAAAMNGTIAMSQMTSMLNDTDRNRKYEVAINTAVQHFVQCHGRAPVVLDIGTGTGLLAMFAARAGAEIVYGCEMFAAMAEVAREVTELNCPGKIKISNKKSTDLVVGEGLDLPCKADMCVNEIYDSVLLGEAVLPTLRHAMESLLVKNPVIVPSGAVTFGMLLSSPSLRASHDISTTSFCPGIPMARNAAAARCVGGRKPLPLQHDSVDDAKELSDAFEALSFNFGEVFPEDGCRSRTMTVEATSDGVLDAIMMTWDLALSPGISYST